MYKRKFKKFGKDSYIIPKFRALEGSKYIEIGDNCYIGKNVLLTATASYNSQKYNPQIILGTRSNIGDYSHVTCINKIYIGKNVGMGREVLISDNSHGFGSIDEFDRRPAKRPLVSPGPVIIEDNCWIGEKCCILPGVKIGRGSTLGAGAVCRLSTPPYSIVIGNPAKVIGFVGTPEEIFEMEKSMYPEDERIPLDTLTKNYDKYYTKKIKEIVKIIK